MKTKQQLKDEAWAEYSKLKDLNLKAYKSAFESYERKCKEINKEFERKCEEIDKMKEEK